MNITEEQSRAAFDRFINPQGINCEESHYSHGSTQAEWRAWKAGIAYAQREEARKGLEWRLASNPFPQTTKKQAPLSTEPRVISASKDQ